ncbi:unnamed protein product (mitochondrion) [Plasmodiophora brassicae]|uniref:J domain-containing protein n=2 Tax=Plasmodiophora brassicae TaxID=37360 RepID=A0A3P3Y288_PLABS|nr:unnamed protein product [Plasmodiophora brassicae]
MKQCFYEVLCVPRDASDADLRKAYRRLALEWHPDKNLHRQDEAEARFKLIQEAFETLSDPDERAFYDGHRDHILNDQMGADVDDRSARDPLIDLAVYFSAACFDGFTDKEGGFFDVFTRAFERIDELESGNGSRNPYPKFGRTDSPWSDVNEFYREWGNFSTGRSFTWANQWRTSDAGERRTKRAMEKENRTHQNKARRQYVDTVNRLVTWVRKKDPRVAAHQEEVRRQMRAKEAELKEREERRKQRYEEDRQRWRTLEQQRIIEGEQRRREAYGDIDDEEQNSDASDESIVECVPCGKQFRSAKQFENHERSKKHKQNVAALRHELEAEDALLQQLKIDDELDDGNPSPDVITVDIEPLDEDETEMQPTAVQKSKRKKKKGLRVANFGHEEVPDEEQADDIVRQGAVEPPADEEAQDVTKKSKQRRRRRDKASDPSGAAPPTPDPSMPFSCERCHAGFPSKTRLFTHLNQHPSHKSLKSNRVPRAPIKAAM